MIKNYKLILFLFLPFFIQAQDGTLDPSFGNNGKVVGDFAETTRFEGMALQSDGKVVATGARGSEMMVARYLADGTPDISFGTDGFFFDDMGSSAGGYKVLIQADGKIIVFGTIRVAANKFALLATRLLADGSGYDVSFGTDGFYINQISASSFPEDDILDAAFLSDGKIGITGRSYSGQRDMIIVGRLTADGQNDAGFGDDGVTLIDLNTFSRANALVEADNGDLVITGTTDSRSIFIARFDGNGDAVTSFGTDGFTYFNEANSINNSANDIVLLPNGQFLVGGNAFDFDEIDNDIALYRFNADGSLDTNFGTNGFVKVARDDNESIQSLILQADGQVLAGGSTGGFNSSFAISRFSVDGVQDMSFGNNGWSVNDIGPGFNGDGITEMVQLNNGNIIAAGYTLDDNSIYGYAVAKFTSTLSSLDDLTEFGIEVRVFPNIINAEIITLELTTEESLELNISLLNSLGQTMKVWENGTSFDVGTTQQSLELPTNLSAGSYYILLETGKGRTALPVRKL